MVEHPAFGKPPIVSNFVGELMARDPITGHAYQNIVKKCQKKVKVMQHAHLKDSLSEEVQLIKTLNPSVARNTDCQHSKYLLLCKHILWASPLWLQWTRAYLICISSWVGKIRRIHRSIKIIIYMRVVFSQRHTNSLIHQHSNTTGQGWCESERAMIRLDINLSVSDSKIRN